MSGLVSGEACQIVAVVLDEAAAAVSADLTALLSGCRRQRSAIGRPTASSASDCGGSLNESHCGQPMALVTIPQVEAARPEGLTQSGAAMGQSAAGLTIGSASSRAR
ncbi:MAG: hypothetical protein U5N53_24570 [Mycobacterium sp.]|nr:hypothetical protein [Mycobacterium sp.]